jgi:hypothetical protein
MTNAAAVGTSYLGTSAQGLRSEGRTSDADGLRQTRASGRPPRVGTTVSCTRSRRQPGPALPSGHRTFLIGCDEPSGAKPESWPSSLSRERRRINQSCVSNRISSVVLPAYFQS